MLELERKVAEVQGLKDLADEQVREEQK